MSSTRITVTDAARKLPDVVDRVANKGEQFLLIKGKKPVARIMPIVTSKKLRELPDIVARLPKMSGEDLSAFEQDVIKARQLEQMEGLRNPWE
jgi:prevent-host-death family protein